MRIQRYILHELGQVWRVKLLENTWIASGIAVALPLWLYLSGGEGAIWPLFGTSNQLLAGLSLTLVTVWLYKTGSNWLYTGIPMVVVSISTIAMLMEVRRYLADGNYLLLVIGGIILALQVWVVGEAIGAVRRARAGLAPAGAGG